MRANAYFYPDILFVSVPSFLGLFSLANLLLSIDRVVQQCWIVNAEPAFPNTSLSTQK